MSRLSLFDLDGTLLDGDTDELWCDFLIDEGRLDRAVFEPANRDVVARYRAGTIPAQTFCDFYASTFAGCTAAEWMPLRARFIAERAAPRLRARGRRAVTACRSAGERVVLTTATNRFLAEPLAALLGVDALIATELGVSATGAFTGRTAGVLNMRDGKLVRLAAWLAGEAMTQAALEDARFYSDSINDLPLLEAVGRPVAVDADALLAEVAAKRGWPIESFA